MEGGGKSTMMLGVEELTCKFPTSAATLRLFVTNDPTKTDPDPSLELSPVRASLLVWPSGDVVDAAELCDETAESFSSSSSLLLRTGESPCNANETSSCDNCLVPVAGGVIGDETMVRCGTGVSGDDDTDDDDEAEDAADEDPADDDDDDEAEDLLLDPGDTEPDTTGATAAGTGVDGFDSGR
jgi:hypothetical protein